jgi:ABC-type glycerol-3-phosphate transport system substrate-binding protein
MRARIFALLALAATAATAACTNASPLLPSTAQALPSGKHLDETPSTPPTTTTTTGGNDERGSGTFGSGH